jgi:hypothetical protein
MGEDQVVPIGTAGAVRGPGFQYFQAMEMDLVAASAAGNFPDLDARGARSPPGNDSRSSLK